MITVVIPVGPNPANRRYLGEAIASVKAQTQKADEILLVDDQAHLEPRQDVRIWKTPWLSGVAHAFNFGVALASNPLVILMGSDDRLQPWALADCWKAWTKRPDEHGYFYMDVEYSTGETQNLPCNAAMVHKGLWVHTGGFPPEASVGASDHIFINMLMVKRGDAGHLWHVESERPPYWHREHGENDTHQRGAKFYSARIAVRETFAEIWEKPVWPRM